MLLKSIIDVSGESNIDSWILFAVSFKLIYRFSIVAWFSMLSRKCRGIAREPQFLRHCSLPATWIVSWREYRETDHVVFATTKVGELAT